MVGLLAGVGALFQLIALVGGIWILVEAFKMSVGQGFLTLCVPCYIFYFVFGLLEHPQKNLMIILWLGGSVIGGALQGAAAGMAQPMLVPAR